MILSRRAGAGRGGFDGPGGVSYGCCGAMRGVPARTRYPRKKRPPMLSHVAASATNLLKGKPAQPPKGVPELLAALAAIRAKRAELEREEQDLLAATRAALREQQDALEDLKRKVRESGIEVDAAHAAPPVSPSEAAARPTSDPVLSSN